MKVGNTYITDDVPSSEEEEMSGDEELEEGDNEAVGIEMNENGEGAAQKVYLPSQENEEESTTLECDETAYVFLHQVMPGDPCLSFDVIQDDLGEDRASRFPLTMTLIAGTQAERAHQNRLLIMKLSNVAPTKENRERDDEESNSESDDDDEDIDSKPVLDYATVPHAGCVNRIKATTVAGKPIVASWSDTGKVYLWDISHPHTATNNQHVMASYMLNNEAPKPMFMFKGHSTEGYALAWNSLSPGMLATGDCKRDIHLWKPTDSGSWLVDQRSYKGHESSVEDIQWSPGEFNVMASCSSDKSIRIWDIRVAPDRACMLTKSEAHESDVNVIGWNKFDPFILSGGDDGHIKVWDLRSFPSKPAICTFKHHVAPITSVEWHPKDSSVFAASGSDDQLTLWDLGVEQDAEQQSQEQLSPEISALPPQLLFIHQGQKEIKELHWHPQMPGVLLSTSQTGFNVFRTISV